MGNKLIVKAKATSIKQIALITLKISVSSLGIYNYSKASSSPSVKVSVPKRHSYKNMIAIKTSIATNKESETICNSYNSFLRITGISPIPSSTIQDCLITSRCLNPVS
jgi:hypothetical protein